VEKVIEQVDNIEKDVEEIKAMMKTLDARLYEIQSRR
jgi:prefoldin subunit 5